MTLTFKPADTLTLRRAKKPLGRPTKAAIAAATEDYDVREQRLFHAMEALYGEWGFSELQRAIQRQRKRLAQRHAQAVVAEGWIV